MAVDSALKHVRKLPPGVEDLRQLSAHLAILSFDARRVVEQPVLVNLCALAWLMREHRTIHRLSSGVVNLVDDTDLRVVPSAPPPLLRRPWILTSRKPEKGDALFGSTVELAGYPVEDRIFLIGLTYPDGILVSSWRPQWSAEGIEIGLEGSAGLINDFDAWHEWAQDAARFALMFGLLLDAEGTPILLDGSGEKSQNKGSRGYKNARSGAWNTRRVYVDEAGSVYHPSQGGGGGASTISEHLQASQRYVTGHLKRQPYGPGRSMRKWVYVQAYEARRWVAPCRGTRIDVQRVEE